ncbi:GntR family transcriptional regulator [Paucibacter aquatile]|uniref:GntR family transcriptional regulator n=1 Tax=Kinneretia aquatilis TaxID=2070761 RepID=A0A2N8KU76_9BURK|nr:PLP-dependent aminotransferase family protein [Paucibacter aquatile]PND37017.1 GntR family transcriptional regulator [Paucibacter aquatile]
MSAPRYKQLLDRLAQDIRSGALRPGTRLPPLRQLARREGLALVTASRVYAELAGMGLVSGEVGRGTFVRDPSLPAGHGLDLGVLAPDLVDLGFNYPTLPGQAELLRSGLRQLAQGGDLEAMLRYQPHGGRPHDRATVARHLASRGLHTIAEQVLLVDGAQHGLACVGLALLQPGDVVAIDALSYPGFRLLAETLRLELVAVPAAGHGAGPDLAALDRLCQQRRVRALYTMPTLHNPLGWVMELAEREALAALAEQHELLLIEDAAYAYLVERAPPPLAMLAPERTVYISGLSKSVAAGLRLGFVHAPKACIAALERAIRASTWSTPGLTTALGCAWLEDGTVDRLEREKRADARERQRLAAELLGPLPRIGHPGSYFLWLPLGEDVRADRVAAELLQGGISVSTAAPYTGKRDGSEPQAIRLALGSVDRAALTPALRAVRQVIEAHSVL